MFCNSFISLLLMSFISVMDFISLSEFRFDHLIAVFEQKKTSFSAILLTLALNFCWNFLFYLFNGPIKNMLFFYCLYTLKTNYYHLYQWICLMVFFKHPISISYQIHQFWVTFQSNYKITIILHLFHINNSQHIVYNTNFEHFVLFCIGSHWWTAIYLNKPWLKITIN